ncbi:MAG TPA: heavy metal translocating P-type ATPase [Ignavibacteria bacterium]|nr:cadmium-translocating P-type ATPase [Bacteroidota bacterium]HRI85488.1 heavy metal translocating P-type ATPase [Ignavibacteria bacterium]HRJ99705.1 heavy metal translocating P-type ATPase [Ignavibacteria bacterium]
MSNSEKIKDKFKTDKVKSVKEELFEFDIIGMNCNGCAESIKTYIEKLDGILKVEINFASESGEIIFNSEQVSKLKIISEIRKLGYEVSGEDEEYISEQLKKKNLKDQRFKIIISSVLSLIIMILSMKDHIHLPEFLHLPEKILLPVLTLLSTVVIFWCGAKFIRGAWNSLKSLSFDMNTLISLGSLSAYFYSLVITINIVFDLNISSLASSTEVFYETGAMIITFILIGNYLESVMKNKTQTSVQKLKDLQAKVVNVIRDGNEMFIPFKKVRVNDIVLVKTGDKIPVDGKITEGYCVVDESAMTGESLPVEKSIGDDLMSGTVLRNGFVKMQAILVGNNTMLSKIISLVKNASSSKPKIQKIADKISSVFVPIVILISIFTFLYWHLIADAAFDRSLLFAVSVLIIACPCALGLASPIAIVIGVGRAAENGILFNNADAIENLKNVDTVCFDKTGTLTTGKMSVKNIYTRNGFSEYELMKYIYSVEKLSSHPIAKSIILHAIDNNVLPYNKVSDFKNESGFGVSALVNDKKVLIGNEELFRKNNISFPEIFYNSGYTNLFVSIDNKISGIIEIEDKLKDNAVNVIKDLKEKKLNIYMITGDSENAAGKTASELGIKNYSFKTLPDEKEQIISKLQKKNRNVAMIGDGINDAPSLASANVGIAVGSGQDIAIDSADVIFVKDDLTNIMKSIVISEKTVRIIKQNFFWAFFYNAVAIPLAAGLLVPYGIYISPVMAAMLMAFSDVVTVIGNSLRLKYVKLEK